MATERSKSLCLKSNFYAIIGYLEHDITSAR